MRLGMAAGLVLAFASAAAAPGVAQGTGAAGTVPRALASNGAVVAMPEIAGLGCPEMAETLRLIDESRYRGWQPVPKDHPDRPIFEYEHRLAAAYYTRCIMARNLLADPGPAFARGFEAP